MSQPQNGRPIQDATIADKWSDQTPSFTPATLEMAERIREMRARAAKEPVNDREITEEEMERDDAARDAEDAAAREEEDREYRASLAEENGPESA